MWYNHNMDFKSIGNYIKKHNIINKGDHIVLGLSGGPDSVCLFFVLNSLAKELDLKIYPVHINHKFRPGAAEKDAEFSKSLSAKLGWECRAYEVDCNALAKTEGLSPEEAGRKARYEAFREVYNQVIAEHKGDEVKLAVAQNKDDQVETVLFRIIRGTGLEGIGAMREASKGIGEMEIIRPLLTYTKKEILDFLHDNEIEYCTDKTNEAEIYTRNKIRLSLIPDLEREYNPNLKDTIFRMSKTAAEDADFISELARELYDKAYGLAEEAADNNAGSDSDLDERRIILLDRRTIGDAHSAIGKRAIGIALKEMGVSRDIAYSHLEEAYGAAKRYGPSILIEFPMGYRMEAAYNLLRFFRLNHCKKEQQPDVKIVIYHNKEAEDFIENKAKGKNYIILSEDKLNGEYPNGYKINLRTREPGDVLTITGGKHKKLKDILVDEKVPKSLRESLPVVAIGKRILWIPALKRVTKDFIYESHKDDSFVIVEFVV